MEKNKMIKEDNFLIILNKIRKRPNLYMYYHSPFLLRSYLDGYIQCLNDNNLYRDSGFAKYFNENFNDFISEHYRNETSVGWDKIINFYSSNQEKAFWNFFELLDEFIADSGLDVEEIK
jgi:hypothetical protein